MSQIHLEPDEFADLAMAFLLDAIRDETLLKDNEEFRAFLKSMDNKGMKSELMKRYLHMNGESRLRYKKIQDVFRGGNSSKINIEQDRSLEDSKETVTDKIVGVAKKALGLKRANEDFDRDLCKRIFRKVKEVRFNTSKPITEERLDKIIDYCINEREEQNNG